MITEQMIEERARQNHREYMRTWRANNRDKVNAYQRAWNKSYKERTGKAYSSEMQRRKAERELRAELGE